MSFDEPADDLHGECRLEIDRLASELRMRKDYADQVREQALTIRRLEAEVRQLEAHTAPTRP